jgi:uncharacterized protein with GYD domain
MLTAMHVGNKILLRSRDAKFQLFKKGGLDMTLYLIEETASSEAIAALMKDPQDRTEHIRSLFEAVGGKLLHFFIAYNENTAYLLAEIPDQESLAEVVWAFQAGGGPTAIRATPLMTFTEAVDVWKKAGSLDYSPPIR